MISPIKGAVATRQPKRVKLRGSLKQIQLEIHVDDTSCCIRCTRLRSKFSLQANLGIVVG
jgi:hypothetical protein